MLRFVNFKFCPKCGEPSLQANDTKSFVCVSCGFTYYHSPVAVAVGIVEADGQIILTKRAHEPRKGFLALPGGFVDYQESLEGALVRELQEELNLTVARLTYLCSHWERDLFRDVESFSSIAFFVVQVEDITTTQAQDDVEAFFFVRLNDINYNDLAYESDKVALKRYRKLGYKN